MKKNITLSVAIAILLFTFTGCSSNADTRNLAEPSDTLYVERKSSGSKISAHGSFNILNMSNEIMYSGECWNSEANAVGHPLEIISTDGESVIFEFQYGDITDQHTICPGESILLGRSLAYMYITVTDKDANNDNNDAYVKAESSGTGLNLSGDYVVVADKQGVIYTANGWLTEEAAKNHPLEIACCGHEITIALAHGDAYSEHIINSGETKTIKAADSYLYVIAE